MTSPSRLFILIAWTMTVVVEPAQINHAIEGAADAKKSLSRRWTTFQNLHDLDVFNGSEALQYDPVTEEPQLPSMPSLADFRPPDKVLKSSHDATVIMNQLYQLKKDFCKSEAIVQRIKEEGCIGKNIVNKYCYGQCNSFYIPEGPKKRRGGGSAAGGRRNNQRTTQRSTTPSEYLEDEDLTKAAFKSCPTCRPTKFTWITVTLRCPKLVPPYRKKRIQKIKHCKCRDGE